MMKKILFLFVACCLSMNLSAQFVELMEAQDTSYVDANERLIELTTLVKNVATGDKTLGITRVQNDMVGGHQNYFCWETICYGPFDDKSIQFVTLIPNATDSTFKLTFSPNGDTGTSVATYRIYDVNDTTDFVDQTFVFIVESTTDIAETFQKQGYQLSAAFPQPATERVFFDYALPAGSKAALVLTDLSGKTLATSALNPLGNRVEISTAGFAPGYYLAVMVDKGVTLGSQKVVIR